MTHMAERFANLASAFGGLAGKFPMRWKMAGPARAVRG